MIFQSGKTLISNFLSDATESMQGKVLIKKDQTFFFWFSFIKNKSSKWVLSNTILDLR